MQTISNSKSGRQVCESKVQRVGFLEDHLQVSFHIHVLIEYDFLNIYTSSYSHVIRKYSIV